MEKHIVCFLIAVLCCAGALGAADFSVTLDADGTADYRITSQANVSSEMYSGTFPADDPTMTLEVGKRYAVTVLDSNFHPFQVIAKGATAGTDVALLTQGNAAGSHEGDAGVNWTDDLLNANGTIEFTMTAGLLTAMQQGGRQPGYLCDTHPTSMRGNFTVVTPPASPTAELSSGSALLESGDPFTVSATISNAQPPVTFQWIKNGSALSDGGNTSGATTDTLSISPLQESDSGNYKLQFTDQSKGTFESETITLTVVPMGLLPAGGTIAIALMGALFVGAAVFVLRMRQPA